MWVLCLNSLKRIFFQLFSLFFQVECLLYFDQIGLDEFFDRFDNLVLQFGRTLCDPNREVVEFLGVHLDPLFVKK